MKHGDEKQMKGLSKSRVMLGLQCPKLLWWSAHEPDAPELAVESDSAALHRGHVVGELARSYVPGGVLIDVPYYEIQNRIAATAKAIAEGASAVYEASFEADGVFVAVDILERKRSEFTLTEVKSTLGVKEQHLPDVAVQAHVVRAAGLDVKRMEVMHLNRDCRYPDLSDLFVRTNVTTEVTPLLKSIPDEVEALHEVLEGPPPQAEIGERCNEPYPCPFQGRCWPALPGHHMSTLYRISSKKVAKLAAEGCHTLLDLPETFKASGPAKRQIRSARDGELIVEEGLRNALSELEPPIAFLDFETVMPAVPAWPGCAPYQPVPVQLSCHVLTDGQLRHHEWLADGAGDPREPFAEALLAVCQGAETIVAYNATFEIQRIDQLARAVPRLAVALKKLRKRVLDLLPVVRDHVYHPDFRGSFSLKSVLPALVSGFGYDDLDIQDGGAAAASLEVLLLGEGALTSVDKDALRRQLLAYCERDTLAMVKLYDRLRELAPTVRRQ